jgi:hypothetical protein
LCSLEHCLGFGCSGGGDVSKGILFALSNHGYKESSDAKLNEDLFTSKAICRHKLHFSSSSRKYFFQQKPSVGDRIFPFHSEM